MKHGFIKVALASPQLFVGATDKNMTIIKKTVAQCVKRGAEIVAFGEMSITGSTLGSMLYYESLLGGAEDAVRELVAYSKTVPAIIVVGAPIRINKNIVNAALVVHGGTICGMSIKNDGYEKFDFSYADCNFVAASKLLFSVPSLNACFGIVIGEDFDSLSPKSQGLVASGGELIVNISAAPALIDSFIMRQKKIEMLSDRLVCTYAYVSTGKGESVAKNVYCGDTIVAENGEIIFSCEGGDADYAIVESDIDAISKRQVQLMPSGGEKQSCAVVSINAKNTLADITRSIDNLPFVPSSREFDRIFSIMGRGIYARMKEMNTDKVIFGFSGGLDSTMTLIACKKMFDKYNLNPKNIIAVTMSGHGTGKRSKTNARALVSTLGITSIDIPIVDAVNAHLQDINHTELTDSVFEHTQARERAQILMDLSDKYSALMLGTADLSEIALGWSVFGGDQLAQYNPNSSLAKTLIRALMRNYCLTSQNAQAAKIVNDILLMPISMELVKDKEPEKLLGPFELHDFFLYNLIGMGFSVEKVVYLCRLAYPDFSQRNILKHLRMFVIRFFKNHFQRNAGCDGIQITRFDLSDKIIYSEYSDELFLQQIDALLKTTT